MHPSLCFLEKGGNDNLIQKKKASLRLPFLCCFNQGQIQLEREKATAQLCKNFQMKKNTQKASICLLQQKEEKFVQSHAIQMLFQHLESEGEQRKNHWI